MTARTLSSRSVWSNASMRPSYIAPFSALSRSGRFRVMVATPSATLYSTSSAMVLPVTVLLITVLLATAGRGCPSTAPGPPREQLARDGGAHRPDQLAQSHAALLAERLKGRHCEQVGLP